MLMGIWMNLSIIISELAFYENEIGYKAYFRESNGTFKFIGFEGNEQGD